MAHCKFFIVAVAPMAGAAVGTADNVVLNVDVKLPVARGVLITP